MEYNHIFIVNPVSGKGKSTKMAKIIDNYCKEKNIKYKIIYTLKPNHATEIVKTLGDNNVIYSVGGDGTLKEVVNGIVNTNNILNVIPAGSGNDFVKTLKTMPKEVCNIDLCQVNDHYFINIASIGLDAIIASNAELMKKKHIPNCMVYNASIVYSFFKKKDPEIKIDGQNTKITLMAICNGRYYGNGFKMAPVADIRDGLLDIYIIDSLKAFKIPGLFFKFIKGTHGNSKYVHKRYTEQITIESDVELICNVDGEIIRDKRFEFKILPSKIKFDNSDMIGIKEYLKKCKV